MTQSIAQQPQEPEYQDEQQQMYYPPVSNMYQNKADLLDKIKPDLIVEVLRHRLMGEELIDNKWYPVPQLAKRSLSKIGAWEIANLILGVSCQNVSVSKLNDLEIRNRALAISRQAQESCLKNWKEYGITGTDQLGYVNELVFSIAFITLKQSEGAGIRKLIGGITTESRIINENPQEKRSRFGWLRGK